LNEERNERKRERFEKICKTIFRNLDYVSKPFKKKVCKHYNLT
jgi:hypothetical protein